MEALKALNKARKFKQMDLKKAMVRNVCLSEEEMAELRHRAEEEREKRMAAVEAEKQRKKEERQRRIQEKWEKKRREKMRQVEWMKPREDMLCEDSKVGWPPAMVEECKLSMCPFLASPRASSSVYQAPC